MWPRAETCMSLRPLTIEMGAVERRADIRGLLDEEGLE